MSETTPDQENVESDREEAHLGQRLRSIRIARGLSGRTLAEKCGMSPSFISQIEGGQASPSVASLGRIARALRINISDLFESGPLISPYVTRNGQRNCLASSWSRATIEAVVPPGEGSQLECVLITLSGGGMSSKKPQISSAEQVAFTAQGVFELEIEGDLYRLGQGDAALIPAGARYRLSNEGVDAVQVLLIAPSTSVGIGLHRPGKVRWGESDLST